MPNGAAATDNQLIDLTEDTEEPREQLPKPRGNDKLGTSDSD
jgi:hypothetical protein